MGRNGIGKTTLVKAIRNLQVADTFKKTAVDGIFGESSRITYNYGSHTYVFSYDAKFQSLNCHTPIDPSVKSGIEVELPMPYGERFNFFQSISNADHDIRRNIVLENYHRPDELIDFLKNIYATDKFENLKQIIIKDRSYFCLVLPNGRYIREDYLSSGEYFLISLYRRIRARNKLIVIDEIDISLDAAAQVNLVEKLRDFCQKYMVNILFTTHSLAMMQTLKSNELIYVEASEGHLNAECKSFNYVKSLLFGFAGWDKYILTEDDVLEEFLEHVIKRYIPRVFYKYKILHIGGGSNTVTLMTRNERQNFFGNVKDVITVLDGDQRNERYVQRVPNTLFIPWESVEKKLFVEYNAPDSPLPRIPEIRSVGIENANGKSLFKAMLTCRLCSKEEIFEYLCGKCEAEIREFADSLEAFLCD